MAIFNSTKEEKKEKAVKVEKKADTKVKKASKPKADAGMNLTKAPGTIILTPHITEKALTMTVVGTYVFEVAMDATKRDVVAAVRALYGVTPRKVTIVRKNARVYVARSRGRRGTKSGLKKACVFLKKGDKIDLA